MSKKFAPCTTSKASPDSTRDGRIVRRSESTVYYDRDSGRVGYGNKYGERSYNQRPVHADPIKGKRDSIDQNSPWKTQKKTGP